MQLLKNKNITLGLILVALQNALFWYAPWLLFLLNYIDISQVAILQSIGLVVSVLTEVPTGAISDLIGKKKTLQLAFLLAAVFEISVALSTSFTLFAICWAGQFLASSFYSGTMEAFMYDSLVESKSEDKYPKVVLQMNASQNAATAFATLIGGFLYQYWIGLPFFLTGLLKLVGLGLTFFITEPKVDTDKFSFQQFIKQTRLGFNHLFQRSMLKYFIVLLLFGVFMEISYELLDDIAVVDWGYDEVGISIVYTSAILIAIPASFLYEAVRKRVAPYVLVMIGIILLALNYTFSPWINVTIWTALFFLRVFFSPIRTSAISEILNTQTPSNIRATTLSTYQLLRKLPFVFLAVFIGSAMQNWGVRVFSMYFGISLFVLLGLYIAIIAYRKNRILQNTAKT